MAAPVEDRTTAVVFDRKLESHFSQWNKDFTETPCRVQEILHRCEQLKLLERCKRIPVRKATDAEILTRHSKAHLDLLESTAAMTETELKRVSQKYDYIYFHAKSSENAKLALGGVIDLVDAVVSKEVRNGMALIRPPGHHAMKEEYCGYCYLANVAIAAHLMMERHHLKRILILDWDVHHGQGSQFMFYDDPRVMYVSIHRYEHGREWPHLREGDYDFTGNGGGKGYNINIPLNEIGCDNSDYLAIMFNLLFPIFYQFDPELVLVSAGYDCAIGCPEGEMVVTPACFAHFVNLLKPLANGKLAVILEGGYNLKSLAESSALSLRALLGDPTPFITPITAARHSVVESVLNCVKVLHQAWPCLQYQELVEAHKVKAENYPYQGVLRFPPVKDVEFYTSQNRPEMFPLIQDCADALTLRMQSEVNLVIDQLIQTTSLAVPKGRLSVVFEDDNSGLLRQVRTTPLWSDCLCLQNALPSPHAISDCIKASVDSVLSKEVQCGLCCLQSQTPRPPLNGTPVNGNSHSESNLVNTLVHHAVESHHVNRILIVDLCPDPHHKTIIQDSESVLYVALRESSHEGEEPSVSAHSIEIPLAQDSHNDADFISLFLQVVLPVAYQFCPELLVLKLSDLEIPQQTLSRACIGHMTQQLLGLAGGRVIVLARDVVAQGQAAGPGSPGLDTPAATDTDGSVRPVSSVRSDVERGAGNGERAGEGVGRTMSELLEECVSVVLGARCKAVQAGLPSRSMVTTIKRAQDRLKEYWSVLQFRVQLPSISVQKSSGGS